VKVKQVESEKFYFDVLPIHPRPEKLEALSSYVVRLAEANGISSISGLTQTCFSDYLRATHHLYDFPLHSPECLQIAANCTEADIQAMTFHHLGEKFGRTYYPNTCYTFLEKSIAHEARYCPYCLKYYGYRSLLWRFQSLKGCSEHSCYLLDTCCHCNKTIPVFPFQSLVRVTTCNYCLKDLGEGQSQPLPPKEQEETLSFSQDLAFLLSPQSQETMITSPEYPIGKQFSYVRQTNGLSLQEMAKRIMLPTQNVVNVEFAFPGTYTTSFECYFQCAKTLGISFRSIFEGAFAQWRNKEVANDYERQFSEDEVINRVQKSIDMLINYRKPLTKYNTFKSANLLNAPVVPSPTLLKQLENMIHNGRVEQRQKTSLKNQIIEQEILEVMKKLQEAGKLATYSSISEAIKFPYTSLKDDLWDIRALNYIIGYLLCRQRCLDKEEDMLVIRIEIAREQLEEVGEPIVRSTVLQIIERYEVGLSHYSHVKALLENIPTYILRLD